MRLCELLQGTVHGEVDKIFADNTNSDVSNV